MTETSKKDPVRKALDELFGEYVGVNLRMNALDHRLADVRANAAKLQSKIVALARVCEEEIDAESPLGQFLTETAAAGITDGVRAVLQANGSWMMPTEIRTDLLRLGYDLTGYTNIMASIHTVLARLRKSGEVKKGIKKPSREAVYRWAVSETAKDDSVEIMAENPFSQGLKRRFVTKPKKD